MEVKKGELYWVPSKIQPSNCTWCISILVVGCAISNANNFFIIEDGETLSVAKGLDLLSLRHRIPRMIIADKGSSIVALSKKSEILIEIRTRGIQFVICSGKHQFANIMERQISQAKKILNSLRENPEASLYREPQSLTELIGKLSVSNPAWSPALTHS